MQRPISLRKLIYRFTLKRGSTELRSTSYKTDTQTATSIAFLGVAKVLNGPCDSTRPEEVQAHLPSSGVQTHAIQVEYAVDP